MNEAQLLDWLAATDAYAPTLPVHEGSWTPEVAFSEIERRIGMQTQETKPTSAPLGPASRSRAGVLVAAAAFAVVVIIGAIIALTVTGGDQVEPATTVSAPSTTTHAAPPYETAEEAVAAFIWINNQGTAEDFNRAIVASANQMDASEHEEQFRFNQALGTRWTLGACTVNSVTSVTCEVEIDSAEQQLLHFGSFPGLITLRIDDTGLISSWDSVESIMAAAPRTPLDQRRMFEFNEWVKAGNSLPWLELLPAADSTAQLDITPEEAAVRYIAAIERFLAEDGG